MRNNFKIILSSYFLRRRLEFSFFWVHYNSINVEVFVTYATFVTLKTTTANAFYDNFPSIEFLPRLPGHRWWRLISDMDQGLPGRCGVEKKYFPSMKSNPSCPACSIVTILTELCNFDNCLKRLITGSPPRWPGFERGSGHVGFVVDKAALRQFFSECFGFPYQSCHQLLHKPSSIIWGWYTRQVVAALPKGLSHTNNNNPYLQLHTLLVFNKYVNL
jgi:hypothetical protein